MADISGQTLPSILIADDEELNREILITFVERMGYSASGCSNGLQTLCALSERKFGLLLLDVHMPDMDGFEVLEKLRSNEALCSQGVVLVSGTIDVATIKRGQALGVLAYLKKPVNAKELRALIERYIAC